MDQIKDILDLELKAKSDSQYHKVIIDTAIHFGYKTTGSLTDVLDYLMWQSCEPGKSEEGIVAEINFRIKNL